MFGEPRRRWFRFSLRTLFIVLTLAGLWIGWNYDRVRKREEMLRYLNGSGGAGTPGQVDVLDPARAGYRPPWKKLPWTWRVLGAEPVETIHLYAKFNEKDRWYIEHLFPEADLVDQSVPSAY